jgi:hypothetical protein
MAANIKTLLIARFIPNIFLVINKCISLTRGDPEFFD